MSGKGLFRIKKGTGRSEITIETVMRAKGSATALFLLVIASFFDDQVIRLFVLYPADP